MQKELLGQIVDIARSCSVDLAIYDEAFLAKTIVRGCDAAGIKNPADYCARLKESRPEAEAFFQSFRVTYSRFFREPLLFALLDQWIIPGIVRRAPPGSEIRVWSAGCACGQEAYSLAMLLDEQLQSSGKGLRYRIFATDVSRTALAAAQSGVYAAADVDNVPLKYIRAYFVETEGRYAVSPHLRERVGFSFYDLLDASSASPPESIFGNFDIVCCSNLIMYYKAETRWFILKKIERSMSQAGVLAVGEAERAFVKSNGLFLPVSAPAAVFYKPGNTPPAQTEDSSSGKV